MTRKHLSELPDSIILYISEFLTHDDIISFRSTCLVFYHISFGKEILKRFHIQIRHKADKFMDFLSKLKEGRHISLSLYNLEEKCLSKVLSTMSYIGDINISILHLGTLVKYCKHIKRLVLYDDKVDYFSSFDKEDEFETHFKPLLELQQLQELSLKGCNQTYSSTALSIILKHVDKITTFSLESLTVSNSKKPSKLSLYNENHIKHWHFNNVVIISRRGLILPKDVLTFHCVNTIFSPLNEKHIKLKKLIIDGMVPYYAKYWKKNNFIDLEYLELHRGFFYHSDLTVCSKLTEIKLYDCHLSRTFLLKLSSTIEHSLKLLTICSSNDYNDENILQILGKFSNIEFLELIDMKQITMLFLYEIDHKNLNELIIRNCRCFLSHQKRDEVALMSRNVPFVIKLFECVPKRLK